LGHVPARSWRLFFATDDAARRAGLPGCVLRVLVGHLLHHFGTRTELFSILEACFWFVINNLDEWAPLDDLVRAELVACRGMIFQCGAQLDLPVSRCVFCSDSSERGYEIAVTSALPAEVMDLARWKERWRFREVDDPITDRPDTAKQGRIAGGISAVADDSAFSRWAVEANLMQAAAGRRRVGGVAVDTFRAAARPRRVELFHALESRVALMGPRFAAARPAFQDSVVVSVGDNMGEVLATEKGRATDPVLNAQCRRAAGLQVSAGIRWRRRHVETQRNPTDRGSRLACVGDLPPGSIVRRTPQQRRAAFHAAERASARACGLSHADFAAALSVLVPKQARYGARDLPDTTPEAEGASGATLCTNYHLEATTH